METETLLQQVKTQLRAAGPQAWKQIAEATGVKESALRKMAYGDRKNPRLSNLEPVLRYFDKVPA
jgi:transcriptional regulator with XRE-family HTH domain